jgi:hypothetical protein
MHGQWLNYIYHYGVGGICFLVSMKLLYRSGALKWERPSDRFLTKGLIVGLVGFMLVHGVWIASVT